MLLSKTDAIVSGATTVEKSTVNEGTFIDGDARVINSTVQAGAYVCGDAEVINSTVYKDQSIMNVRLVDGVSTLTESDIDFSFLSQTKGLEH